MLLRRIVLQGMNENEKMSRIYGKDNEVTFQILKIVGGIQTRDRK